MDEVASKFAEIYERMSGDMPLFIKSGIEGFISLFLFTLVLFFAFLLIQTAVNLIFKKGSRILPYGICLIGITILFYAVFTPTPVFSSDNKPVRINVEKYIDGSKIGERYMFISEREKSTKALEQCLISRTLLTEPTNNNEKTKYILTLTFSKQNEFEITLSENEVFIEPLPKTGQVMRCVNNSGELFSYISLLMI